MPYLGGAVGLALLVFWLYCLLEVITTDRSVMRNLSKPFWVVVVLLLGAIGGLVWFVAGRPQRTPSTSGGLPYKGNRGGGRPSVTSGPDYQRPGRTTAPDDDPEFLRKLSESNAEHERMLDTWEADLRRREDELRRQRGDGDPTA